MGTFLTLNPSANISVLPTMFAKLVCFAPWAWVATNVLTWCLYHFSARTVDSLSDAVVGVLPYLGLFACFRHWALARVTMRTKCEQFDIRQTTCFVEDDRSFVERNI